MTSIVYVVVSSGGDVFNAGDYLEPGVLGVYESSQRAEEELSNFIRLHLEDDEIEGLAEMTMEELYDTWYEVMETQPFSIQEVATECKLIDPSSVNEGIL